MYITIILVVAVLNLIIISSPANDETHEAAFEWTHPLWGTWDGTIALNGLDSRDFDLTLSAHTQYLSFHISLWFFSVGLYWRKYADSSQCDCADDYVALSELRPLVEEVLTNARVMLVKTYITSGTTRMDLTKQAGVVLSLVEKVAELARVNITGQSNDATMANGFQEGTNGHEH